MKEKRKVLCVHCGAANNFPLEALGKKVLCGRCKNPLPEPGMVVETDAKGIHHLLSSSVLSVLVDFYSPRCSPCQLMHPVLEGLAKRRAGEIMVVKVNVDLHPELASSLGIQSVPTFIIFRKGREMGRISGAMPEADFALWVASRA